MILKFLARLSADISRAYPKSRKYEVEDFKWLVWPANLTKNDARARATGYIAGTIPKCLRPLYGAAEAGKGFASSFTYDLAKIVKM